MIEKVCEYCKQPFKAKRSVLRFCKRQCANKANGQTGPAERLAKMPITTTWSCGGGVDSTAIGVLIVQGKLPKPDLAFMTDVGWERYSTWDYVTKELRPRMRAVGVELHVIKTSDYANNDLVDKNGYVAIPAHKQVDGKTVKMRTHCSGPWKLKVAKRWLREQGVQRCENWIGIAADESQRAKPSKDKWFGHRWPLIEHGLSRRDCLHLVRAAGWATPPRTSCVMCPQQTNQEWRQMAEHEPREFARACQIERMIQEQAPGTYLHYSCLPLGQWAEQAEWDGEEIDVSPRECNPFSQCTEGGCPKAVKAW